MGTQSIIASSFMQLSKRKLRPLVKVNQHHCNNYTALHCVNLEGKNVPNAPYWSI